MGSSRENYEIVADGLSKGVEKTLGSVGNLFKGIGRALTKPSIRDSSNNSVETDGD